MKALLLRLRRAAAQLLIVTSAAGLLTLGASPALAQTPIPPPLHSAVDSNDVDLLTGQLTFSVGQNSIGPDGVGGLAASRSMGLGNSIPTMFSYARLSNPGGAGAEVATIAFMGRSQIFEGDASTWPLMLEGNTLDKDSTNIIYTLADGTVVRFGLVNFPSTSPYNPTYGLLQSVTYPSGEILSFSYSSNLISATWMQVESSLGYALAGTGGMLEWNAAAAANLTASTCASGSCSGGTIYGSQQALGRSFTKSTSGLTVTFTNPQDGSKRVYTIGSDSRVASVARRSSANVTSGTWTYAYSEGNAPPLHPTDYVLTTTVTDPLGNQRVVTSRESTQNILTDTINIPSGGGAGETTSFGYTYDSVYSGLGVLNRITYPEGNATQYTYDAYFNVTERRNIPKSGPGPGETAVTASYLTATSLCTTYKVCNRPEWIQDERGNQTDFTYDPVHGGVLTVTQPSPDGVLPRPQTRYTYSQFTAKYNRAGSLQPALAPVWRLTQTSACATGAPATPPSTPAACVGTADETVTDYTYESSSVANNVRLLSVTKRAGDSATSGLAATNTYAYNARGDLTSDDGPLTAVSDITTYYYDASRWKTLEVGPDPDGAGALTYRAVKTTYRADGQVTNEEIGTAANQGATPPTFIQIRVNAATYDAYARKASDALMADGGRLTFTEYAYDAASRLICSAIRLAPTGSPSNACAPTGAAADPDRVTFTEYDAANRVAKITSGYGATSPYSPRVEKQVVSRTGNGKEQEVADGNGNLTTYEYDDLDRLSKTRYPNTSGGGSSTTDYDGYAYDATNNVTQRRLRDSSTVNYTFDNLNRVTYRDGVKAWYSYDNFSRPAVTASRNVSDGDRSITYEWDALSRLINTYDYRDAATRLLTHETYDLAGRRTALQWSDGFYVTYARNALGEVTNIYENGSTAIVAYAYNNFGDRTSVLHGSGASTLNSYAYFTKVMTGKTLDLASAGNDQIYSYTWNGAYQQKSRTMSTTGGNWSWPAGATGTTSYTVDGLNRYTAVGAATPTYDGRGNTTSDGTSSYGYDLQNRMTTGPSVSFLYDPAERLDTVTTSSTETRFTYAGAALIAETDASNAILRRYVPGPEVDETAVWYEGSGTGSRRYLLIDEHGSVVAVTNASGAALGINAYDEYGRPASANLGRFQYTGQVWMPEVGLYNYKARFYSPYTGRFMQTDPSGYDDGLNWYAFVGNDPLNKVDPTGKEAACITLGTSCSIVGSGVTFEQAGAFIGTVFGLAGSALDLVPGDEIPAAAGGAKLGGHIGRSADAQIARNAADGARRAAQGRTDIRATNPGSRTQSESTLRTADGRKAVDPVTGKGRRVDEVVFDGKGGAKSYEITGPGVDKTAQAAKEARIMQNGGVYVRDRQTGDLCKLSGVCERVNVQ